MTEEYVSAALTDVPAVSAFDCGVASLNDWLPSQAWRAQKAGTARTFVWTTEHDPASVWAYYSIAPTEIMRSEVTGSIAGGYSTIPAYLLARLAVSSRLRGHGYGGELLADALTRIVAAARLVGGRLIVVDAIDAGAANFYRHHHFIPVKGDPHRLVIKMATVEQYLADSPT